jgi:hypothetical protein
MSSNCSSFIKKLYAREEIEAKKRIGVTIEISCYTCYTCIQVLAPINGFATCAVRT